MPIKVYKPTTNGRRNMSSLTYEEITRNKPEKRLTTRSNKRGIWHVWYWRSWRHWLEWTQSCTQSFRSWYQKRWNIRIDTKVKPKWPNSQF